MSKIGDYVHYHAKNYLIHGITENSNQAIDVGFWMQVKDKMKQKVITQKYSTTDIQKIQDQYNKYRRLVTIDSNMESVRNKILELLLEKTSANKDNITIDWERGSIQGGNSNKQINDSIEKLQKIRNQKEVVPDVAHVRLSKTVQKFIDFYKNKLSSIKDIDRATHIAKVLDEADATLKDMVNAQRDYIKEKREAIPGISMNEDVLAKETADQIIKLVQQAFAIESVGAISNLIGNFEEYIAVAADLAAQGLAEDAIVEKIKAGFAQGGSKSVSGKITGQLIDLDQNVAKEIVKELNSSFIKKDDNGTYSFKTTYNSKSKLDAAFTANLNGKIKKTKLSIKSYNLNSSHPISLVKGSPLSTFLFNMGDVNLTNHFLNIFAAHPDTNSFSIFKTCRDYAEASLAYYLLWAAMSGKGTGRGDDAIADIFVVNDNKSKTDVKMWDIGSLVQTIVDKSELNNSLIISPALNMISLNNSYRKGEAIQKRLSRLIINTHAIKIKVAISASTLR